MDHLRTFDDILGNLPQGIFVRCHEEILYANKAAAVAFGFASVRNLTDHRNITGLMGTYVQPQKDPERRFTYFSTVEGDLFLPM